MLPIILAIVGSGLALGIHFKVNKIAENMEREEKSGWQIRVFRVRIGAIATYILIGCILIPGIIIVG